MTDIWEYAIRILPYVLPIVMGCPVFLVNKNTREAAIWSRVAVWVRVALILVAIGQQNVFSETDPFGPLRPANEPLPQTPCPHVPKEALIFVLGSSASYTTTSNHTFLRVAGENLLSFSRKDDGIAVSGRLYSSDRRIVAQIIENEFHLNPSHYFRQERPDRHTLVVFDQENQRVLYIRYMNASAIKILGTFHTARGIVQIGEEDVMLPHGDRRKSFCFGNAKVGIQIK
jgi:hypothetical protein